LTRFEFIVGKLHIYIYTYINYIQIRITTFNGQPIGFLDID